MTIDRPRRAPWETPLVLKSVLFAATLLAAAPSVAKEPPLPAGLRIDRVVLMMRHGVRPPTKSPPMPAGTASATWPTWSVKPGYLTEHGRAAVALLGTGDRTRWMATGLLPRTSCGAIRVIADSDERTIETARAYAAALAPGCSVSITHRPQDEPDPLFTPLEAPGVVFDPAAARAAVLTAAGGERGFAAEEARLRPLLARLDAILCAPVTPGCTISPTPPARTATTGRPDAIASRITLPNVSVRLAKAKTSAAA